MSMIDQLQGSFSDQTQIIEYHKNWWTNFIREKADSFGYAISSEVLNLLVKRWAEFDKSVSIKNIFIKFCPSLKIQELLGKEKVILILLS